MEELEAKLARRAVGVDWTQNPLIALGLGKELTALNLPIEELRKVVQQFIRGVLKIYHPDTNITNARGEEVYRKFAEIGDLFDKPGAFEVAWREFRRLVEGLPTDALTRAEQTLFSTESVLKRAQEENALLQEKLNEKKSRIVDKESATRRFYRNRLYEMLCTPAFLLPEGSHTVVRSLQENTTIITIEFHVAWDLGSKGKNPTELVSEALLSEKPFCEVFYNRDKTLDVKAPKVSRDISLLTNSKLQEAYRARLHDLGELLEKHRGVKTFFAKPALYEVTEGKICYKSPEGKERIRVILGSLPLYDPVNKARYVFIASKRTEELELAGPYVADFAKPWLVEGQLLVTADQRKLRSTPFREIASVTPEFPFRAHEVVVRIL